MVRLITVLILLTFLLGCVELQGQRISIYHDEKGDRLLLLLHYDGIHDSGYNEYGNGKKQIRHAVMHGDALLVEWPGELCMGTIAEFAEDEDILPTGRVLASAVLEQVTTHSLGTFRDVDRRIGAVQGIEISGISRLLPMVNAAISADLIKNNEEHVALEAAMNGHSWIRLDGHALVGSWPVDPADWAYEKQDVFQDLATKGPLMVPLSLIDEGDEITVILGKSREPNIVRRIVEDEYEPSLEAVIEESVSERYDPKMASLLLGDARNLEKQDVYWLEKIIEWGPPEEQVRAVLTVARDVNHKRHLDAFAWLKTWGDEWNRAQASPEAPERNANPHPAAYVRAWEEWYRSMVYFPLGITEDP